MINASVDFGLIFFSKKVIFKLFLVIILIIHCFKKTKGLL